jgi:hypothetical protein
LPGPGTYRNAAPRVRLRRHESLHPGDDEGPPHNNEGFRLMA